MRKPFNFVNAVTEVTGVNAVVRQTRGVLQQVTKSTLDTLLANQTRDTDVNSLERARKLAFDIHTSLADVDSTILRRDVFDRVFTSRAESRKAMALFDADLSGDITLPEFTQAFIHFHQERKSIDAGV